MVLRKKDIINNFGMSLFQAYKGDKLPYPIGVDRKRDGQRMKVIVRNEKAFAFGRTGDEYYPPDYTEQLQYHIDEILRAVGKDSDVLDWHSWDCECKAIWKPGDEERWDSVWGKTQSIMKMGRVLKNGVYVFDKKLVDEEHMELLRTDIKLHVFDFVDLCVYEKPFADKTPLFLTDEEDIGDFESSRRGKLEYAYSLLRKKGKSMIHLEPLHIAYNKKEVTALFKKFLKEGEEGAMLKFLDVPYVTFLRGPMGYKWKPIDTIDGVIVDVLPGNKGTKNEKRGGRYLVRLIKGKNKKGYIFGAEVKVNMRKDVERVEHYEKRKQLKGFIIELQYQGSSKVSKESLRSPQVRVDKKGKARIRFDLPKVKLKRA